MLDLHSANLRVIRTWEPHHYKLFAENAFERVLGEMISQANDSVLRLRKHESGRHAMMLRSSAIFQQ